MTDIAYDYDLIPDSEVFDHIWVDRLGGYIYLRFISTGTVVSHVIPDWLDDDTIASVTSWGQVWNWHLKNSAPRGPEIDHESYNFVSRETDEVEASEDVVEDVSLPSIDADRITATIDVDRLAHLLIQRLSDRGWTVDNTADTALRASLAEALLHMDVEPNTEQTEDVTEIYDVTEGDLISVHFVDVPEDKRHTVNSMAVSFVEFMKDNLGSDLNALVLGTDMSSLRSVMERITS